MAEKSGQCLCGAVNFKATPKSDEMGVCHCGMCQRWAGGVFMAVSCGDTVSVNDDSELGVYVSSEWGERCFCKKCGTTLFWRMRDGSNTSVAVPAFDDTSGLDFKSEIFIDEKPAYYAFANNTKKQTSAEMFAELTDHLSEKGA